jgi:hypothetical protein
MKIVNSAPMDDNSDDGWETPRQRAEELYQRFHASGRRANHNDIPGNSFGIDHA